MGAGRPGGGEPLHPAQAELLEFFEFEHLPRPLRDVSEEFHRLAHRLVNRGDLSGAELTTALRKLVESKDCAVRACLRTRKLREREATREAASLEAQRRVAD